MLTAPVEFWLTMFVDDIGFLCLASRRHLGRRGARVSQHALRKILEEMQKRMGSSALFTYQRGSDRYDFSTVYTVSTVPDQEST